MSNETKGISDLEVNENLKFQRRDWAAQRVGWVAMGTVVVAALLGLFGGTGLLGGSQAKASSEDAVVSVSYERFLRFMKPTTLEIDLGREAGKEGKVSVWLDRRYLEGFQVQQITPQPSSAKSGPKRSTYLFEVDASSGTTAVSFDLLPEQRIGPLKGVVRIDDGKPVSFEQFVYP